MVSLSDEPLFLSYPRQLPLFPLPPHTYRTGYVKNAWTDWLDQEWIKVTGMMYPAEPVNNTAWMPSTSRLEYHTTLPGSEGPIAPVLSVDNAFQGRLVENPGKTGLIEGLRAYVSGLLGPSLSWMASLGRALIGEDLSTPASSTETGDRGSTSSLPTQDTDTET